MNDDLDGRVDLHGEVDQHGVGHRRGQGQVGGEVVDGPLDDLRRREALELDAELGQVGVGEVVGRLRLAVEAIGPVPVKTVGAHVAHSDSPISAT